MEQTQDLNRKESTSLVASPLIALLDTKIYAAGSSIVSAADNLEMKPRTFALFLAIASPLVAACTSSEPDSGVSPPSAEAEPPAFLGDTDPTQWVTVYDPGRAENGYTLALYGRRTPILIDMNGNVAHSWPEARVKSRVRLLTNGHLLGLALDRAIVEYDWTGNLVWQAPIERGIPHHDVVRLHNGNTLVIVFVEDERSDHILEIDRRGEPVWEWRSVVHLADHYAPDNPDGDITHLNSVQEIPSNRWFDQGDARFRPGNLLVSSRNLDLVFVVDRETKDVVWTYRQELDRQHEALMIEPGLPFAGNILLFNNHYGHRYRYRQSQVIELDPSTAKILWIYETEGFYSPTGGIEQPLANGNILISSTRGGRLFEVDRRGRIVWQWVPPFEPNRPSRVAYDHCPQLEALGRPKPRPIRPEPDYRHVDPRTYLFLRPGALSKLLIDGIERRVIPAKNACARVFVPPAADVHLGFGINGRGVARSGRTEYRARFSVTASVADGADGSVLFDQLLDLKVAKWRETAVPLDGLALQWVDLCLSIEGAGPASEAEPTRFAYWTQPVILPRGDTPSVEDGLPAASLTAEEAEAQRDHLRALGYID